MNRRQFVRAGIGLGMVGVAPRAAPAASIQHEPTHRSASGRRVTHFGAVGDGTHDDTDALQRAVEEGDGVLFLPRGTYRITRTITIDLAAHGNTSILGDGTARVVMEGPGPAFHFIGTHEGTAEPADFAEQVWDRERLPLLSGFEIRGAHDEAIGLRLERTVQATLTALLVRRCRTGVHLVNRNRNLVIDHCHIYHNRAVGIHFDHVNLHQAIVADSHVSYNPAAGIWLDGGEMRNFQFTGNDIEYNHDESREGSADVLIDMRSEGSSFREGTVAGNTIQARPTPGGANVRFLGGEGLRSGGLLAISGNLIGSQTDNLHLADCRGVSVTGNSIYSAARYSLHLQRCANVVLSGNAIDWNPDHNGKQLVDGIAIEDSDAVVLSGSVIDNSFLGSAEEGGTINVARSRDVTISDCQVLDPRYRGVVLRDAVRCRVTGCTVLDRRDPPTMLASVQVAGQSRDNLIAGNTINRGSLAIPDGTAMLSGNLEVHAAT